MDGSDLALKPRASGHPSLICQCGLKLSITEDKSIDIKITYLQRLKKDGESILIMAPRAVMYNNGAVVIATLFCFQVVNSLHINHAYDNWTSFTNTLDFEKGQNTEHPGGMNISGNDTGFANITPFTTAGLVLAALGFVENSISLLALLHMRRPFGAFHYLLINLAVSDLVVVTLALIGTTIFLFAVLNLDPGDQAAGALMCVSRVFMEISYLSLLAPLLATSALVINQYIAILKPLDYNRIVNEKRVYIFLGLSWFAIGFFSLLVHIISYPYQSHHENLISTTDGCVFYESSLYSPLVSYSFLVILIAISLGISYIYFRMYQEIRKQLGYVHRNNTVRRESEGHAPNGQSKGGATKLDATIAILFATILVFWVPGIADALILIHNEECETCVIFHFIASLLFFANSLCDPLIYGIRMPDCREGYRRMLKKWCQSHFQDFQSRAISKEDSIKTKQLVVYHKADSDTSSYAVNV